MRLSPQTGKEDCHIIDFVDSTSRVSGIVSTPTLFGLHPDEVIEGETLLLSIFEDTEMNYETSIDAAPEDLEERAAKLFQEDSDAQGTKEDNASSEIGLNIDNVPDPRSVTYIDYDNPFDLVQDSSGAPHLINISRFGWVGCGADVYVLECMGKGYIKIEPAVDDEGPSPALLGAYTSAHDLNSPGEQMLHAHYVQPIPEWELQRSQYKKTRFRRPRHILSARTLDEAVRGCDNYATSKVARGNLAFG